MKKLVCELCGSTDLIKKDGVYVCESCGGKFSVEEAKKMMVEGTVQVQGTVKIDDSHRLENYFIQADVALEAGETEKAAEYCDKILENNARDANAWLLKGKITKDSTYFKKALEYAAQESKEKKQDIEQNIADWYIKYLTDGLTKYKFPASLSIIIDRYTLLDDIEKLVPKNMIDTDIIKKAVTTYISEDLDITGVITLSNHPSLCFETEEEENYKNFYILFSLLKKGGLISKEGYDIIAAQICALTTKIITQAEDKFIKERYNNHGEAWDSHQDAFSQTWKKALLLFDEIYDQSSLPMVEETCRYLNNRLDFFLNIEWTKGRDTFTFTDKYKEEMRAKINKYISIFEHNTETSAKDTDSLPVYKKFHQLCSSCQKEFEYLPSDEIYDDEKGTVVCPHCGAINNPTTLLAEKDTNDATAKEDDEETDDTSSAEEGVSSLQKNVLHNITIFWLTAELILFGILMLHQTNGDLTRLTVVKDIKVRTQAKADKTQKMQTMTKESLTVSTSQKIYEQTDNIEMIVRWIKVDYADTRKTTSSTSSAEIEKYCSILKETINNKVSVQGLEIKEISCSQGNITQDIKERFPEVYRSSDYQYELYAEYKHIFAKLSLQANTLGIYTIPPISFENSTSEAYTFNVYSVSSLLEDIKQGNVEKVIAFTSNNEQALTQFLSLKIDNQNALFYLFKQFPEKTADLLKLVTDVNMKDDAGTSILSLAVAHQNNTLLDYLIEHGANVNYIDNKGRTAVMYAGIKGNLYAAKKLVAAKANLYLSKDGNWTAYKYAKEFNHNQTAEVVKPLYNELIFFTHDCDVCRPKKQKFEEYVKNYQSLKIKYVPVSKIGEYMGNKIQYNPVILAQDSATGNGRYREGWDASEESLVDLLHQ